MNIKFNLHENGKDVFLIDMELTTANRQLLEGLVPNVLDQYMPPTPEVPTSVIRHVPDAYKGFMHLKCTACGKIHAFNSYEPISTRDCSCGEDIPLYKLKDIQYACTKCGQTYTYKTNRTEAEFGIKCKECGEYNDVEYDSELDMYINKV